MNQPKLSKIYKDETGFDDDPVEEIETHSVGDLIEFFSQFPKDMIVVATWEDQRMPIYNAFMCTDINDKPILVINVDSSQCD